MQLGSIYLIRNDLTYPYLQYVGQTTDFKARMRAYAHGGHALIGDAINLYGWDHFSFLELERIPSEELDEAEKFWINFFGTRYPDGYNVLEGGKRSPRTEQMRTRMSQIQRDRVRRGIHNFVTDNPTYQMMEDGTHNFLADNPSRDPEKLARAQRTKRKNRGIRDWVDEIFYGGK